MPAQPRPLPEPTQAPGGAGDWERARLAWQVHALERLVEYGLEVAAGIARQAAGDAGPAPAAVVGEIGLAYDRVARAVRFTVALHGKLIKKHKARVAETAAAEPPAPDEAESCVSREDLEESRRERIGRIVGRVIEAHAEDEEDEERMALDYNAYERLHDPDIYGPLLDRPISELVAVICRDLGVTPDWASLAEEAWAQAEICSGQVGAPLRAWLEGRPPDDPAFGPPPLGSPMALSRLEPPAAPP